MRPDKLFQDLARLFEIAGGAMRITTQIIDVLYFGIELGGAVEVYSCCGPFTFPLVGICSSKDIGRLSVIRCDGFCVLFYGSIPITDPGVLSR